MKVSLNWLKDYLDIPLDPDTLSELLTSIGLEVEGMETVESIPGGLAGVVTGEVKECVKHPNADKLSLTKVDVGAGELLQIVCGAPNVAARKKVLVATIGTELHPIEGEPFTIGKGKIRGEVSEGMICAEDELGLGHDHAGIMVLPADTKVGIPAKTYLGLKTDYVYEIGLTPNRSDATNHLGVARDLAAAMKINYGHSGEVKMPDVAGFAVDNTELTVNVRVENPEACPRYSGVCIQGITVGESPEWLKTRLKSIGVRSINNMVDATNFILHELGQPLHAFDLNRVGGHAVVVKTLPEGTGFLSLDEVERKLSAEDLMICDGNSKGMCIGGVFGGFGSGIKESTHDIFLESAHFNPKWIRRSSMRHNLRTDAARVYEKGSDPNLTVYALKRAAMLMCELGGGKIASEIVDIYPSPVKPVEVEVAYEYVNRLIGLDLDHGRIRDILTALKMEVVSETATTFTVAVPTDKADVTRPADVVEEILRIYGLNNVPEPLHIRSAVVISPQPDPIAVRNLIADMLASQGFNEMMAVSLSQSRYYKGSGWDESRLVFVNNTANVHLDVMRPAMVYSALEAVAHNLNRKQSNLRLFEFGRTYAKNEDRYREEGRLSMTLTGQRWPENWLNEDKAEVSYYSLKSAVDQVFNRLGIQGYQESEADADIFQYGMKYHRGQQELVQFGRLDGKLARGMDVKAEVFFADFNWDNIMSSLKKIQLAVSEIGRFPSVRRDLALIVSQSVRFSDIAAIANKVGKPIIQSVNLLDVYVNDDQLGAGKKSYAIGCMFEDPTKTLQDKEVDKIMDKLIYVCKEQLGAVVRGA